MAGAGRGGGSPAAARRRPPPSRPPAGRGRAVQVVRVRGAAAECGLRRRQAGARMWGRSEVLGGCGSRAEFPPVPSPWRVCRCCGCSAEESSGVLREGFRPWFCAGWPYGMTGRACLVTWSLKREF